MRLTTYSCLKRIKNIGVVPVIIMGLVFLVTTPASAAVTSVTPSTWNIIGLDSNNVNAPTPNRFPVGAKICGDTSGAPITATFHWDTGGTDDGTYIHERFGSSFPDVNLTFSTTTDAAGVCAGKYSADAYFEIEVTRDSNAYTKTRRYYIKAGVFSTPRPRELYVERLVSQSRNYVQDVRLNGVSIPAGGSMSLMVGNTYDITLVSKTATQGYEQLETFINFPNTIFQVLSVNTDYSAYGGSVPQTGHKYVYADGCGWENDPNSPNRRSCNGDGKAGGTIATTYRLKILSGGGTSETLSSLIYDFSGSSFHYNADYSTGYRIANIVGPSSVKINKSFSPKAIAPGGTSTMTIKLTNPTSETFTGVNFTDLAGWPAGLAVSSPGTTSVCGGSLVTTANSVSFSGGTLSPNSVCTINITVTAATAGTYLNTTGNLYINTNIDTTNYGSDTLTASSAPACTSGQTLAVWIVPSGTTIPPDTGGSTTTPGTPLSGNKASDVATAKAQANLSAKSGSNTSGSADADSITNDSTSWETYGYKDSGQFIRFEVDTSKYSGVSMNFDVNNANNGPTAITVSYSTDGTNYTNQYTINNPSTAGFVSHTPDFSGVTSTTGSTYFKIVGTGAQTNNSGNGFYLDEILFTGCRVATPPPTISKSFLSDPIIKGATSTLRFTINNTSAGNQALTGVTFTDVLPAGLSVADSSTNPVCGGILTTTASTRTIALTGGSLAAGGNCTFDVTVTGTTEGQYENVTGYISSTQSGTSTNYATDTLTVVAPPVIAKSFDPTSIYTSLPTNTATLTFTITNPNQGTTLNGIGFTDTLPAGLTIVDSTSSQCGGTNNLTTTAATRIVALTGGSLAANSSCSFTVTVTGTAAGTKSSTTTAVTSTEGGSGNTASASVVVSDRTPYIDLTKQVSTNGTAWNTFIGVATGGNVYYRFKVYNSGDIPFTAISVSDPILATSSVDPATCNWATYLPLDPGYTATCVKGPISAASGWHWNTATTTGTYATGTKDSTSSTAMYATTGLTIVKSAAQTYFTAADNVLNYSYVVKNTGYAPLLEPANVADDKSTDESCPAISTAIVTATGNPGDGDNYLDSGEQITCTATYTIIAADVAAKLVTNNATATVDGVTSLPASLTIPLAPNISILKSANGAATANATPGSIIIYEVQLLNSGGSGTNVVLRDDMSPYTAFCLNCYSGNPFSFTDGPAYSVPASGLALGTPEYSSDNGSTFTYIPVSGGGGAPADYDGNVTNWKIPMTGTIDAGGGFKINYQVKVK